VLAIDRGTTGNRAILFDHDTRIVASSYREFTQLYPQPGWVEHDPEEIWETTRAVVAEATAQVDPSKIVAVGITNQRETVVCWDRKTGAPLHNAIVWQDRRTSARCEMLKQAGREGDIRFRTGLLCDPYFSATKIEWLLKNVPATRAGVFGTVDSWIVWKLTRGKTYATDVSNASRTLLFHLRDQKWDETLLELFGVNETSLPEVRSSSSAYGAVAGDLFGFSAPILGVAGDQQASMFAQGCFRPGIVKNTYGTGLFLMENTGPTPRTSDKLLSTAACKIGGQAEYALEGSVFIGGAAVQWLRDGLRIIQSSAETEELAASLNSNDDVFFVPALAGLGAPHWDPRARGTIVGLTGRTRRAHLARAALEAMAYQTREVSEVMAEELGTPLEKLKVDGGACVNNWMMQFQADILGVPVERPAVVETTALGAAGLAGLGAGVWNDREDFLTHRKIERTFVPRMPADQGDVLFARWKEAVQRARAWAPG